MVGQDGFALGVDLGTSNTVAVLRWPDGRTRPLTVDGQPILPSGVFADPAGGLHVGQDAQRLARTDPARYEPNPKRRIDEATVLLGEYELATADLFAAILRTVARSAVEAVGFLPPGVVTYPASWGVRRRAVLADAIARAGWPPVDPAGTGSPAHSGGTTRLLPEPVAAARYFAEVLRRPVPVGSALAVFDFGGGTLDVAVVRNSGADPAGRPTFEVAAAGGLAELGGLDLDEALVEQLGTVIAAEDPAVWRRLSEPESQVQWRDRRQFWEDVRGAKEMLSRAMVAPVAVPGVDRAIHLTREELERSTAPLLRRAVAETGAVLNRAGVDPRQLAGLFLVGGSSRVPLVARLLHAELGVAPTVLEQPELPVAEGALAELAAGSTVAVSVGAPAGPGSVPPATGRAASAPGDVLGAAPAGWAPTPAPIPFGAVPTSPGGPSGGPFLPAGQPVPPGGSGYPTKPRGRFRRRTVLVGAGVALALAGVAAAAVFYFVRSDYRELAFEPFVEINTIDAQVDQRPSYMFTSVVGDRAYLAHQLPDNRLQVIAATASTGRQLWRVETQAAAPGYAGWAGVVALPDGVAVVAEASGSTPGSMLLLDAADGRKRWDRSLLDDDEVWFFDDRAVVLERTENRLVGLDLRNGETRWDHRNRPSEYGSSATKVVPVTRRADLGKPGRPAGLPAVYAGADRQVLQILGDRSIRVVDVTSGKPRAKASVADPDAFVVAHEGTLYVANADDAYRLDAFDLAKLGEPATLHTAAGELRPQALVACGDHRVCLLQWSGFDKKTVELLAVDTEQKEEKVVWRKKTPDADSLLPVNEHLLVRYEPVVGEATVRLFDPAGKPSPAWEEAARRVDGGNLLLFSNLSTSEGDPSVGGLAVGAKQPVPLGQLKQVRAATCSWNTSVIVCAGEKEFRFRRFVRD